MREGGRGEEGMRKDEVEGDTDKLFATSDFRDEWVVVLQWKIMRDRQ